MVVIINGVDQGSVTTAQLQKPWTTVSFTKPDVTAAGSSGAWVTANSPITVFTVTGLVRLRFYMVVTTGFTSTGGTGTLAFGVSGNTGQFLTGPVTVNGSNLPTGAVWGAASSPASRAANDPGSGAWSLSNSGDAIITIATNNMTAGGAVIYCEYVALSASATVTAATP